MKLNTTSLLSLSVLTIFALLSTTSCKKSSDGGSSAGISATLSGSGSGFQAKSTLGLYSQSSGYIAVAGVMPKANDSLILEVDISDTAKLNTPMTTDLWPTEGIYYYSVQSFTDYEAWAQSGHGTITVTSWDQTNHKIAGTFSATMLNQSGIGAADSVIATNGTFNTSYVVEP
jgi:hypothetical protein